MVHIRCGHVVVAALLTLVSGCTTLSQEDVRPELFADPPVVSDEARDLYGDRAEAAYEQVSDLLLEYSTPEILLDPEAAPPGADDLTTGLVEAMTETAATEWRSDVDDALAGDAEAVEVVNLLRFYDLDTTDATRPRTGEVVAEQSVSGGEVSLADQATDTDAATATDGATATSGPTTPLQVSLVHRARIRLEEDRVPYEVIVVRPLTFTLTPEGDRWLMSTFSGSLSTRTLVGDPPTVVDDSATSTGR